VIRRKTNRRHMTGDHHGRTVRRAMLLVTATDDILGTHRPKPPSKAGLRRRLREAEAQANALRVQLAQLDEVAGTRRPGESAGH
jgi:hypothetical protein